MLGNQELRQPLLAGVPESPPPLLAGVPSQLLAPRGPGRRQWGNRPSPARRCNSKTLLVVGMVVLVTALAAAERLLFKTLVDAVPLDNTTAGSMSVALLYLAFVFLAAVCMLVHTMCTSPDIDAETTGINKGHMFVVGLLETLHFLTMFNAGPFVPAPWTALLQQAFLPLTMALSAVVFRSKYTCWHIVGAVVVAVAVVVALLPAIHTGTGNPLAHAQRVGSYVYVAGTVPLAFSAVYKEWCLRDKHMDPYYFVTWTTFFQLMISIVLTPVVLSAQGVRDGFIVSDAAAALRRGMECVFFAPVQHSQDCSCDSVLGLLVAFFATTTALGYLMPYSMARMGLQGHYRALATGTVVATVALSGFPAPSCGAPAWRGFQWPDVVAMVALAGGLAAYYRRPEPEGDWSTIIDDFPPGFTYRAPVRPASPPDGNFFPQDDFR